MGKRESISREEFLKHLWRSKLLSSEEFRTAVQNLPATERGRSVARVLIKTGVLTKFQAQLLLMGKTQGLVLGQYRILEQIGKGGMGRVFKAMHDTMKRTVALKVLAAKLVETPKARKLFQREVLAAGKLSHTNIVTAYDANQISDRHYLVMEYIDGPNLDQLVRQHGRLPIPLICEIVRQIAQGLQHAYEMEMVHCDIKPTNVVVQRAPGRSTGILVKILDFGLARFQHVNMQDELYGEKNKVMGTPDFLSPEQTRSLQDLSIASDLYSLGCTFYFLLTCRVPFPGGTSIEKLARHNTEQPTPIVELRPDVPEIIAAMVRKLMEKKPEDRYKTPAELAAELAPFAMVEAGPVLDAVRAGREIDLASSMAEGESEDLSAPQQEEDAEGMMESTFPPDFAPTPMSEISLLEPDSPVTPERDHVGMSTTLVLSLGLTATALAALAIWFMLR